MIARIITLVFLVLHCSSFGQNQVENLDVKIMATHFDQDIPANYYSRVDRKVVDIFSKRGVINAKGSTFVVYPSLQIIQFDKIEGIKKAIQYFGYENIQEVTKEELEKIKVLLEACELKLDKVTEYESSKIKKISDVIERLSEARDRKAIAKTQTRELLNRVESMMNEDNRTHLFKTEDDRKNFSKGINTNVV